jgi:hypothetical protein
MQHAYLRSLTAKWLSRTRSDSPSAVLSLMQVSWPWGGRKQGAGIKRLVSLNCCGPAFSRRSQGPIASSASQPFAGCGLVLGLC